MCLAVFAAMAACPASYPELVTILKRSEKARGRN